MSSDKNEEDGDMEGVWFIVGGGLSDQRVPLAKDEQARLAAALKVSVRLCQAHRQGWHKTKKEQGCVLCIQKTKTP